MKKTLNEQISDEKKFKRDITLNINSFNKLDFWEDRESLARMLQHIVITKKGTYPNNPDFGVGIEDYMFEKADASTVNELTIKINEQINKWIDKDDSIEIKVNVKYIKIPEKTHYVNLAVFFTVTRDDTLNPTNNDDYVLTLYLTEDVKNRKIISKIDF